MLKKFFFSILLLSVFLVTWFILRSKNVEAVNKNLKDSAAPLSLVNFYDLGVKNIAASNFALRSGDKTSSLMLVPDPDSKKINIVRVNSGRVLGVLDDLDASSTITVDSQGGFVYASAGNTSSIKKYALNDLSEGELVKPFLEFSDKSRTGRVVSLRYLNAGVDSRLFVGFTNDRENWFSFFLPDGSFEKNIDLYLTVPEYIEVDAVSGLIYIGDSMTGTLKMYDTNGVFLDNIIESVDQIALKSLRLYTCVQDGYLLGIGAEDDKFLVFDRQNRTLLGTYKVPGISVAKNVELLQTTLDGYPRGVLLADVPSNGVKVLDLQEFAAQSGITSCLNDPVLAGDYEGPAAPQNLTILSVGSGNIQLSWQGIDTDDAVVYELIANGEAIGRTENASYTVILKNNTKPSVFAVRARNKLGFISKLSNTVRYVAPISIATSTPNTPTFAPPAYESPKDATPPRVVISPSGGGFSASLLVSLSSNEPARIYYTLDGSAPSPLTGTEYKGSITLEDTTLIKYIAVDEAGNSTPVQSSNYELRVPTKPVVVPLPPEPEPVVSLINKSLKTPAEKLDKELILNDNFSGSESAVGIFTGELAEDVMLFVSQNKANRVEVWSITDEKPVVILPDILMPNAITVDQDERTVYVIESGSYAVRKYYVDDIKRGNIRPDAIWKSDAGSSEEPVSVAVYRSNGVTKLYILYKSASGTKVVVTDTAGNVLARWKALSNGLQSIVADPANERLIISDVRDNSLKIYSSSGEFIKEVGKKNFKGDPKSPILYACGNEGYLLVYDVSADNFRVFDRQDLNYLASFNIKDIADTKSFTILQRYHPKFTSGALIAESYSKFIVVTPWSNISQATNMTTCK